NLLRRAGRWRRNGRAVPPARQHAILVAAHLGHGVGDPDAPGDKQDAGEQSQSIVDHALAVIVGLASRILLETFDRRIPFGWRHAGSPAAKRQDPAALIVARNVRRHRSSLALSRCVAAMLPAYMSRM